MIYFTDCYAKLWSIDTSGRFPKARISTSEKNQDGEYVNSSWFVSFLGKAKEDAEELDGTERIKILKGKITNIYSKEKEKSYLNVSVFSFEIQDGREDSDEDEPKQKSKKPVRRQERVEDENPDELPF